MGRNFKEVKSMGRKGRGKDVKCLRGPTYAVGPGGLAMCK